MSDRVAVIATHVRRGLFQSAPGVGRHAAIHFVLLIVAFVFALPFLWMASTSLKEATQVESYPPVYIPTPVVWKNYVEALTFLPFHQYFFNTTLISALVIVGDILSASFVAYGFARLRAPGRNFLFIVMISTMIVPLAVRLLPTFLLFKWMGWVNTFLPLIVPAFFGTPYFIFFVRQFYRTIPQELSDAARVDGASEFRIWWQIMVPLSRPVLIAIGIFAFANVWNDFLYPLVFLTDRTKWTISIALSAMIDATGEDIQFWNLMMAAAFASVAPMVVVFGFAQRYFTQGVTLTGIKG